MKKSRFTLAAIFLAITAIATAQTIEASTYVERTHISPKMGTTVGWIFDNQIEVGGFYQQSTVELKAESGRPLRYENELYGAYMAYPLVGNQRANVKLNVRTGVSNGENFVITPSFQGNYQAAKMVTLGAGVGVRSFRPTMMASLKIKI
jgi:hypothetical protein